MVSTNIKCIIMFFYYILIQTNYCKIYIQIYIRNVSHTVKKYHLKCLFT